MPSFADAVVLPFSCGQMFDLVADIERYPEFVPLYQESRILERAGQRVVVRQRVGVGGLQFPFASEAELERPRRIHIRSGDFPFRRLAIQWHFEAVDEGCRTTFRMDYSLDLPGLLRPSQAVLGKLGRQTLSAFVDRAHHLYGAG